MDKLPRPSSDLKEEVRQRIGPGDYRVTIHQSPALGWHAMVHGNRQARVERLQDQADTAVADLSERYEFE
jgi:hypothetical protein